MTCDKYRLSRIRLHSYDAPQSQRQETVMTSARDTPATEVGTLDPRDRDADGFLIDARGKPRQRMPDV
jgi:hypothetical protein